MDSILTSIKKMLGIIEEDESFDIDIIIHINTAFSTLTQLGVGPKEGFVIRDKTTLWTDFIDDIRLENVRSYIYLKVRQVFDPPTNSSVLDAISRQISELEWRMNITAEKLDERMT